MPDSSTSLRDERPALQRAMRLAQDGRLAEAAAACDALLAAHPDLVEAWQLAGHIRQRRRDFAGMLAAAQRACELAPAVAAGQLRWVECLIYCGRTAEALSRLRHLEQAWAKDAAQQVAVGTFYTHCARYGDACRCFERATALDPANVHARASLAAAATTLGRLDAAEALLRGLLADRPDDYDAWLSLANLRTWSPRENHVAALRAHLDRLARPAGEAPLCYALSKELDDLGEHEAAFAVLMRGAGARRRAMRYQVERDLAAIEAIIATFPASSFPAAPTQDRGREAIFVMGLPRSGTTLVDRILSSHPQVESLGELREFTFAVMRAAGPGEPGQLPLIRDCASLDFAALGRSYLEAVAPYRGDRARFIDKTPANYLYAGLIHRALPGARLVLLRRHPLDACHAMLRTLFQAGYPFSYDLTDLGRYYVAWHRLVEHWRNVMPGVILEVEYERLVGDQPGETRRLLQHCGLAWDDACLDFHHNPAPSATASAVQVRRPLYSTSVGRWRRHAAALEPLVRILRDAGIPLD